MTDCCWFSAHGGSARQWWGPGSDSAFDHMIRRSASADLNRNRRLSDTHRRSLSVVKATKLWPFVSGPRPTTLAVALILTFAASSWRLRWSRVWPERSQNPSVADQVDKKQITAVRASSNRHSPCVIRQILYTRARPRLRALARRSGGGRRICHRTPRLPLRDRAEAAAPSRAFLSNSRFSTLENWSFSCTFGCRRCCQPERRRIKGAAAPTQRQVTGGGGLRKPAVFAPAAPLFWCRNCAFTGKSWGNDKAHFNFIVYFFCLCVCFVSLRVAFSPKRERIQQRAAGWCRVFLSNYRIKQRLFIFISLPTFEPNKM